MQRTAIHAVTFVARCDSGLHIGGSPDELVIGGSDNPVIKNPATGQPYIPGSSLKGKMRAEIEKQLGKAGGRNDDLPCGCAEDSCPVCRLFGAHMNTRSTLGPSRIMVRDGRLRSGGDIENKTENVINRHTGAAQHPRSNERVVEGTEFDLQIVLQVFDLDSGFSYQDRCGTSHQGDTALQAVVADSLRLVQLTGLGGGTSRGSGAVAFRDFRLDGGSWDLWSD